MTITIFILVSVPDPKPTPTQIAFSIARVILKAIYVPDEVWGQDYTHTCTSTFALITDNLNRVVAKLWVIYIQLEYLVTR